MQNRVNEKEGKEFECVYVCVYVLKEREKEKYKISQMHVGCDYTLTIILSLFAIGCTHY